MELIQKIIAFVGSELFLAGLLAVLSVAGTVMTFIIQYFATDASKKAWLEKVVDTLQKIENAIRRRMGKEEIK
jgi:membrane protein YqaA with SNARE-associated domain